MRAKNALNICFISRRFFPAISGMSAYAKNLVESLRDRGHSITVISQYRKPTDLNVYRDGEPVSIPGIDVIGLPQNGEGTNGNFELDIDALVEKIVSENKKRRFDLIHAQFAYPPGLAALLAGKILGKPVVVSIQGGDGHWFGTCCGYHRKVMKTILRNSRALIIGTESFAHEVRDLNDENPDFIILPGATNTDMFRRFRSNEKMAFRKRFDVPIDKTVIISFGRLDWRKGIRELLEAFARIMSCRSDVHLVLAGVGPHEHEISELIDLLQVRQNVTQLGYIDYLNAPEVYGCGDIFCSPTYAEGFSNTIVEALATGLPVVATDVVGVRDVIEDGETGILVPPRDPVALAAALLRVLSEPNTWKKLTAAGQAAVESKWNWRRLSEEVEKVYFQKLSINHADNWSLSDCGDPFGETCKFRQSPHLL